MASAVLAPGYHALPEGHIANVVTCLEMTAKPGRRPAPPLEGARFERMGGGDTGRYLSLFRAIGRDIMWFSRLMMEEEKLASIIGDPQVESHALVKNGMDIGLLELDFREEGVCELSFFGLVPSAIGLGAGRFLMNQALERAWAHDISRLWVHTCTLDHPSALSFYQRSGFRPYQVMVEVHPDPRLTGHMPEDASPQVALIKR